MATVPGQQQVPGLPQPPAKQPPPSKRAQRALQRRVGFQAPSRAARGPSFRSVFSAARAGSFWGLVRRHLPGLLMPGRKNVGDGRNHGSNSRAMNQQQAPWLRKKLW